jgi:hypothetical protein
MFTFYLRFDVTGAVAGPDTQELSEKSEPSVKIAYPGGNRAWIRRRQPKTTKTL